MLTVTDVLEVVAEFEPFEPRGISVALLAWELELHDRAVRDVIELAAANGLLEPVGTDRRIGEQLWQLTDQGRARLADRLSDQMR